MACCNFFDGDNCCWWIVIGALVLLLISGCGCGCGCNNR